MYICRFEFNLPKLANQKSPTKLLRGNFKKWKFYLDHMNWIEIEGETNLTNYSPPPEHIMFLEKNFDTTLK